MVRRVVWVALVLIGVAATALLFRDRLTGTLLERGRAAYEQGDFKESLALSDRRLTEHPDDAEAIRAKARSLLRLERGGEAYPLFERLGGDRLQAEDLILTGNELLRSDRRLPALAAFDAAAKLDPRNGSSAALQSTKVGKDDLRLTKQAERLAVVPSGAGLGELVLAVASADDPARGPVATPSLLTRLLRLDRATLQRIDGAPAARKLMARLMLEDGRIDEAKAWLKRVPGSDDPEADWLMSRVLLVEGNLEAAGTAADKARGFGADDFTRLESAPYVGAKRCAECHSKIFASHQKTGHAETLATGTAMKSVPLPRRPVQDPGNPSVEHAFERVAGEVRLESKVDGQVYRAVLDYALGSGRHGMTMLGRQESGRHRSLRISYYSTGGEHWDLTNGLPDRQATPEEYLGQLLDEESFAKCINCHTTRFNSEGEWTGPEAADRGIGCERCHGPAGHHLRAVDLGFPDPAIARPKSAQPAQRLKLCGQCHSSDGIIPPSEPRFVRFQATTLPFSRCVTESGGKLDCVGCHDPHRGLETDHRYYEVRCLACHNGNGSGASTPSAEVRIEAVAATPCPIDSKTGCIGCHMPKAKEVMPFTDFTDHHIRVHRSPNGSIPAPASH